MSLKLEFTTEDGVQTHEIILASLPGLAALIILVISWTKGSIGGWLFILLGLFGIMYPFASGRDFTWDLLILPGFSILIGILFALGEDG